MGNNAKKYKLTDETIVINGKTLYRIEACKEFSILNPSLAFGLPADANSKVTIHPGDKGGFVESESNLSQKKNSWIANNACVYDEGFVGGNAVVKGTAHVSGAACVYDQAFVTGNAIVADSAVVYDNAIVFGNVSIRNNSNISGQCRIYGNVVNPVSISGNAKITGQALITGRARITGDVIVDGHYVTISGDAFLDGDAVINSDKDYMVFREVWKQDGMAANFTWTRSNRMWNIPGFFYGSSAELIELVSKRADEVYRRCIEETVRYVESINSIMIK